MKIILSPAKKMITDTDSIAPDGLPEFIEKTTEIQSWLKSKSKEELKTIWKCNDKITEQNFNRLENIGHQIRDRQRQHERQRDHRATRQPV